MSSASNSIPLSAKFRVGLCGGPRCRSRNLPASLTLRPQNSTARQVGDSGGLRGAIGKTRAYCTAPLGPPRSRIWPAQPGLPCRRLQFDRSTEQAVFALRAPAVWKAQDTHAEELKSAVSASPWGPQLDLGRWRVAVPQSSEPIAQERIRKTRPMRMRGAGWRQPMGKTGPLILLALQSKLRNPDDVAKKFSGKAPLVWGNPETLTN